MTPSPFLLQLAVLLLPGVIWAHVDAKFGSARVTTSAEFFVRACVFGLVSYAITYSIYSTLGWEFAFVDISKADKQVVLSMPLGRQIAGATFVGSVASLIWLYGTRYKLLTRVLQKIGATTAFGDHDVWEYALNVSNRASEYVNIRYFERELTYTGYVRLFSYTGDSREILLTDVEVYDFAGTHLFSAPTLYLSFPKDGVHMEFPYVEDATTEVSAAEGVIPASE